jgi:hypothetical protein
MLVERRGPSSTALTPTTSTTMTLSASSSVASLLTPRSAQLLNDYDEAVSESGSARNMSTNSTDGTSTRKMSAEIGAHNDKLAHTDDGPAAPSAPAPHDDIDDVRPATMLGSSANGSRGSSSRKQKRRSTQLNASALVAAGLISSPNTAASSTAAVDAPTALAESEALLSARSATGASRPPPPSEPPPPSLSSSSTSGSKKKKKDGSKRDVVSAPTITDADAPS